MEGRPYRIAHVANSLTRASGVSYFCARLTEYLADDGYEVDLYVWWLGADSLLPMRPSVRVFETRHKGLHFVARPDLIHVHSLWTRIGHDACLYARKHGIPYVISPHGMLTAWALRNRWWKKLLGLLLFQYKDLSRAAALHATAEAEVENFKRLRLNTRFGVVPLGTDIPSLSREDTSTGPQVRCRRNRLVLFVSRIHPKKGLVHLIEAWANLKYPNETTRNTQHTKAKPGKEGWTLIIAGPNSEGHEEVLMGLARSLGLRVAKNVGDNKLDVLSETCATADILFLGPVYGVDKELLHCAASLFVLPSYSENFGAVIADSLACGVPVITTRGTPWAVLEGSVGGVPLRESLLRTEAEKPRCGWWVDVGTVPLIRALQEAMSLPPEELIRMGANGKALVEAQYAWPAVAAQMAELYSSVHAR